MMDALNKCLFWDVNDIVSFCLRQLSRYGDSASNILSLRIPLESAQLERYFPLKHTQDIYKIISFMEINDRDYFFLIDILVLLTICGVAALSTKIDYLFSWFHLSATNYLDEYELTYLLIKIRFCFRRLGLRSLQYTEAELHHIAFIARIQSDGTVLRGFSKNQFEKWVETSREGKLLLQLVASLRKINTIVSTMSKRVYQVAAVCEASPRVLGLSAPPLHLFIDKMKLLSNQSYPIFRSHNAVSIAVPLLHGSNDVMFLRVDEIHPLSADAKTALGQTPRHLHTIKSFHLRYEVGPHLLLPLVRLDIDSLLPATDYDITVYTEEYRREPLCIRTTVLPLVQPDYSVAILSPLVDHSSGHLERLSSQLNRAGPVGKTVVFAGPILPLQQMPDLNTNATAIIGSLDSLYRRRWKAAVAARLSSLQVSTEHIVDRDLLFFAGCSLSTRSSNSRIVELIEAISSQYAETITRPCIEVQRGAIKLVFLNEQLRDPLGVCDWLDTLDAELSNAAYADATKQIVVLVRCLSDLLIQLPRKCRRESVHIPPSEDAEVLSGTHELKYGAYFERSRSSLQDDSLLLNALLHVVTSWQSNNSAQRCVLLISTDWSDGFNFDIVLTEDIKVRHESLLPTQIPSNDAFTTDPVLLRLFKGMLDSYVIRLSPPSSHRSVLVSSFLSRLPAISFIGADSNITAAVPLQRSSLLLTSSPRIVHLSYHQVEIEVDVCGDEGCITATLYEMPYYATHTDAALMLRDDKERLVISSTYSSRRAGNASIISKFEKLKSNRCYCVYIDAPLGKGVTSYFRTMPHSVLSKSTLLCNSVESQACGSYHRRHGVIRDLLGSQRPPGFPLFSFQMELSKTKAAARYFRVHGADDDPALFLESKLHNASQQLNICECLPFAFVSAKEQTSKCLVCLMAYVRETFDESELTNLVIFLPEPLVVCMSSAQHPFGFAFKAPEDCSMLLQALFEWKSRFDLREVHVICLADSAVPLLYRFSHAQFGHNITHLILPQVLSTVDSCRFPSGRCRLDMLMWYEDDLLAEDVHFDLRLPTASLADDDGSSPGEDIKPLSYFIDICTVAAPIFMPANYAIRTAVVIRGMSAVSDLVDWVGPVIGKVTSTTATLMIEFTRDLPEVQCLATSPFGDIESIEYDVKAFTPVYFKFQRLLPKRLYILQLPGVKPGLKIGSFRTLEDNPSFVETVLLGNAVMIDNPGLMHAEEAFLDQQHFDVFRCFQIMQKCFQEASFVPTTWSQLLEDLARPLSGIESVVYMGNQSWLQNRRDTIIRVLMDVSLKIKWNESGAPLSLIDALYYNQLQDIIRDSFRVASIAPTLSEVLSSTSSIHLYRHEYSQALGDALVDTIAPYCVSAIQSTFDQSIASYLLEPNDISIQGRRAGIAVDKVGSFAKLRLSLPSESDSFLNDDQTRELAYILQDSTLRQIAVITEFPLFSEQLPREWKAQIQSALTYDTEAIMTMFFDWINVSKLRDMRSVVLVCTAGVPFITEVLHSLSGMKIYQFCTGQFSTKYAISVDLAFYQLQGTLGLMEFCHFPGASVIVNSSASAPRLTLPPSPAQLQYCSGYSSMRVWFDNTNAFYEWKLVHTAPAEDTPPAQLIVGPILGTFSVETGASGKARTLFLPVLYEADSATTLVIELRNVFTSVSTLSSLVLEKETPKVIKLGPLDSNSRYYVAIKSGLLRADSYDFSISTSYAENESNYAFINLNRGNSTSSYDFIADLTDRFRVPFHGLFALIHLNAGITTDAVIGRLPTDATSAALNECKARNEFTPVLRTQIELLLKSIRQFLRDNLNQPSYRELLRSANNLFIPNRCELRHEEHESNIVKLLSVIIEVCHELYFNILANDDSPQETDDAAYQVYSRWLDIAPSAPGTHVWASPNKMIGIETIDLVKASSFDAALERIATATVESRIRIILIESRSASLLQPGVELLDQNSEMGYKFQGFLKRWVLKNQAKKLFMICPFEKNGTSVQTLPIEDENMEAFSLYLLDSVYRSNRSIHDASLADAIENFKSLSSSASVRGKKENLIQQRKRREEERQLEEMKKRKSAEIWQSQSPDGFLLLETQYLNMSAFDATMDYFLVFDVNIINSRGFENIEQHFDYLQPPGWLAMYVPNQTGLFVIDEVILLTRNNPDNKHVLSFIEDDATYKEIKQLFMQSRLYIISQIETIQAMQGNTLALSGCLNEFMLTLWSDCIPDSFKPLFAYLIDPLINAYCLGGARVLEATEAPETFVEAIQLALVYAICMKTCMKMKHIRRWKSNLFTTSMREASIKKEASMDDSDIADLEAETQEKMATEEGEEDGNADEDSDAKVLTFTNKAPTARSSFLGEQDRLTRLTEELERKRVEKVKEMREIGRKFNYTTSFSYKSRVEDGNDSNVIN